jgi:aryl-alcohol dehydrogenase-like predicted oxidoreductase
MEYRSLGNTGVKVAPLALGTMNFGGVTPEAEAIRMIHKALDAGINLLDTSNSYARTESEQVIGRALKDGRRDRVVLATKAFFPTGEDPNDRGSSRRHILRAVQDSLRRLDTDWIDLYQLHRPDFDTPHEETLATLNDLVRGREVAYIGTSGFPAWRLMEGLSISERHGWAKYVTEQPPYNVLDRRIENELVPFAQEYGLGLLTWSPLAMGLAAGRYPSADTVEADSRAGRMGGTMRERVTERATEAGKKFGEIAASAGLTASQLALLWVKEQPGVTAPILGPRTEAQLDDALAILEMKLDPQLAQAIDELNPPGNALADFHNTLGWYKGRVR